MRHRTICAPCSPKRRGWPTLSGGAFDVTVQPLWQLYAAHFAANPDDAAGPPAPRLELARRRVGHRALALDGAGVRLLRPGMAVTLNGIAQGYVTDRVAELLRDAGFASVLVQLGETFAGAPPADGVPWRIGIPVPGRRIGCSRRWTRTTLPSPARAALPRASTPLAGTIICSTPAPAAAPTAARA